MPQGPSERTQAGDRLEDSADLLVTSLCVGDDGELLLGEAAADQALDDAREKLARYNAADASEHTYTADVLAEALGALLELAEVARARTARLQSRPVCAGDGSLSVRRRESGYLAFESTALRGHSGTLRRSPLS